MIDWASELLEEILGDADVPASRYEDATGRYEAVGDWLNREGSSLERFSPQVSAQGSFSIGTVIRPIGDADYDVDAVCELAAGAPFSPETLKSIVGDRLRQSGVYSEMLIPPTGGRRCWTLKYADGSRFHLDILPAMPDVSVRANGIASVDYRFTERAILITDRLSPGVWLTSNPRGWAAWFKVRTEIALHRTLAKALNDNVERLPALGVRSPLQGVVQLLKLHRDVRYSGSDEKPISVIIATLAAQGYVGEGNLYGAFLEVVARLRSGVGVNGHHVVQNPVNPSENFADKWQTYPSRREAFFRWLAQVETFATRLRAAGSSESTIEVLAEGFGSDRVLRAARSMGDRLNKSDVAKARRLDGVVSAAKGRILTGKFEQDHRQLLRWPLDLRYSVTLKAFQSKTGSYYNPLGSREPVRVGQRLLFKMTTNCSEPYSAYWQIVNTGDEAARLRSLRGEWEREEGVEKTEHAQYVGEHAVVCILVKDSVCVARSDEFVVNIV